MTGSHDIVHEIGGEDDTNSNTTRRDDLTRYWRTVTVDFVYKQRAEAGKKWALRNAKLRMSRKLVFASGLLRCFFCHLDPKAASAREALASPAHDIAELLTYMDAELAQTPLELLARAASEFAVEKTTVQKLFDSYDRFLSVMDNSEKHDALESMTGPEMATSVVWEEIRNLSHDLHSGLLDLFFGPNSALRDLTIQYGLF